MSGCLLALFVGLVFLGGTASAEQVVRKADADDIFRLTREEWNARAAATETPAGWTQRIERTSTGAAIVSADSATGIVLKVQPFFRDDTSPPDSIVISSFYPAGFLPWPFSEELRQHLESEARKDVGKAYLVRVDLKKVKTPTAGLDLIEVRLSRVIGK